MLNNLPQCNLHNVSLRILLQQTEMHLFSSPGVLTKKQEERIIIIFVYFQRAAALDPV